jgi:ABC-2 type transport system permease protein
MLISIGYAVAGIVNSLDTGMAVVMILNFAMMFGGNIFWDPENSLALKIFAHLMPVSYLADLFRQLISGTEGLWPLWVDIGAMLGWTALALVVALRTFRFDMELAAPKRPLPVQEAAS